MKRVITEEKLIDFKNHLLEEERSSSTIEKYLRDIRKLMDYAQGREITKTLMLTFKEKLLDQDHYEV